MTDRAEAPIPSETSIVGKLERDIVALEGHTTITSRTLLGHNDNASMAAFKELPIVLLEKHTNVTSRILRRHIGKHKPRPEAKGKGAPVEEVRQVPLTARKTLAIRH